MTYMTTTQELEALAHIAAAHVARRDETFGHQGDILARRHLAEGQGYLAAGDTHRAACQFLYSLEQTCGVFSSTTIDAARLVASDIDNPWAGETARRYGLPGPMADRPPMMTKEA